MMPYIKDYERQHYSPIGGNVAHATNPGQLNYQFTMLAKDYISMHGLSYTHINDVMGALEGAKLEFYRRVAAPYEDKKIKENGDVY